MPSTVNPLLHRVLRCAFAFLALSTAGWQLRAQSQKGSAAKPVFPFAGSWSAEFRGTRYVVLEIRNTQPITGEIKTGSVNADENGNITEVVEGAVQPSPLVEAKMVDGRLLFKTRDADGEWIEYEMSITEPGRASLKIAGMPIKPFVLNKAQ